VLLGAGADIQRLLDTPSAPDAFVRHAMRMPFLRTGKEIPIVAFAPPEANADELLGFRDLLVESVPTLTDAIWLTYLSPHLRGQFFRAAQTFGGLFDAGGGLHTWHISGGIIGLVGRDTWVPGLSSRLEELLTTGPESGVIPLDAPLGEFHSSNVATTEPAPPDDCSAFSEMPYSAVAPHDSSSPGPRRATPILHSQPSFRPASTMPPNPRLRNR